MFPIKLKLRNFMAYREETVLDFQGIHLAVLTGENGAGKSSLLDAITWALWGKARAKRDDELIHLGYSEMEVEFTFGLGDNTYCVIRKRDAQRRGRSDLSLLVQDAGGWRTLTETTIRVTQDKINDLLRLDYDTFVNSAFLLQGRADEFTVKPPGKRKEILSDILGLQIYEVYENRAKARAAEKEKEVAIVTGEIARIEQELAREPEYQAELAAAQQAAKQVTEERQLAEKDMDTLREQYRASEYKKRQLDDLHYRLNEAQRDIDDTAKTVAAVQAHIDSYRAVLQRQAEIEDGLDRLKQARAAVQDWEQRLHESARLAERKHELDTALNAARSKLEGDLRDLAARIDVLRPRLHALEGYSRQLAETQAELDVLQRLDEAQAVDRQTLADLEKETVRLDEQNRQLKTEMDDIKTKLTQLETSAYNCPVCQRPLDEDHRAEVLARFRQEGTAKGDLYRANGSRFKDVTSQQKTLQQRVAEADKKLRAMAPVQRKVATLEQQVDDAQKAAGSLEKLEADQARLQQQLANQEFAVDVVAQLAEVQAELTRLGYDNSAHQQTRLVVDSLVHFEDEGRNLAEARRRLGEEEQRLEKERARHTRLLEQTANDRREVARLEEETKGLAELIARLNQASENYNRLEREERLARDRVAAAKQNLKYLADQAKRRGECEDRLQKQREVLSLYRELQTAFGKKGVQALLIESAIPEIEDETNKLLARMTDSRMQIRFETQREAKSSDGTIETLDIRISDEIGTRDYEMYSGGEAFRVNFAIRVAMSKILARRAGARLQTLVIDEGFGTQDGRGRERLVEAINAIQNDFEKIIVITHIDELRDAFPIRIEVIKTSSGSRVTIR